MTYIHDERTDSSKTRVRIPRLGVKDVTHHASYLLSLAFNPAAIRLRMMDPNPLWIGMKSVSRMSPVSAF
jgi:hypothetical protein